MATSTSSNRKAAPDFDAATERVREAGDRFTEAGRKVTSTYLDSVEKYVSGLADAERKLGEQSQLETVGYLLTTHANLTEDVFKASLAATRELISA